MEEKSAIDPARVVNLERYPIDDPCSTRNAAFARACRRRFHRDGLCMLADFIRPQALELLVGETTERLDGAWFCRSTHNVYLTRDDAAPNHPGAPPGVECRIAPSANPTCAA